MASGQQAAPGIPTENGLRVPMQNRSQVRGRAVADGQCITRRARRTGLSTFNGPGCCSHQPRPNQAVLACEDGLGLAT